MVFHLCTNVGIYYTLCNHMREISVEATTMQQIEKINTQVYPLTFHSLVTLSSILNSKLVTLPGNR